MMPSYHIYKAAGTTKSCPTADTSIFIGEEVPDLVREHGLEALAETFEADAVTLEQTLYESLPGGTYDRLLARMLTRKATHFVVSHGPDRNDAVKKLLAACEHALSDGFREADKMTWASDLVVELETAIAAGKEVVSP